MHLPFGSQEYQKGAIGILAAFFLIITLLFTALAIDSARLWMVKRKLQTIADIGAIEAARSLNCAPDIGDVIKNAQRAAVANGFVGNLAMAPNIVELGSVNTVSGRREFSPNSLAEAVHVRATQKVPASIIARGFFTQDILLSAEATSLANNSLASFGVGMTAININTQNSEMLNQLLGAMLGSPVNLGVLDYRGLLNSKLTLANLIQAQGGISTVDELLATEFTPGELLSLISDGLGVRNDVLPDAVNDVTSLANATVRNTKVSLGQILKVNDNNVRSAAQVGINALSLVTSVAQLSNLSNAISLPEIEVNVLGIKANANIRVIEPPQMVIGPPAGNGDQMCTTARNAQIRVSVPVNADVNLLLVRVEIDLSLNVDVASGTVALQSIENVGNATQLEFAANSSLVTASLSNTAGNAAANLRVTVAGLPITVPVGLVIPPNPSDTFQVTTQIDRPIAEHLPHVVSANGSAAGTFAQIFSNDTSIEVGPLPLGVLSDVLRPLLVSLSQLLIDPLLNVLGIRLNNMDIIVDDVLLSNPAPLVI